MKATKNFCFIFFISLAILSLALAVQNRRKAEYNFSFGKKTFTDLENPGYKIIERIQRPYRYCYEQGILFKDSDTLIESCGLYGHSNIQTYSLSKNEATQLQPLQGNYFGEGADMYYNPDTKVDEIYQMTWRERKV